MKTKSLFSILFVSGLILCGSALLSMVKDYALAQPNHANGLPVLEVPMQNPPAKWLVSFEKIPELNVQQVTIVDPETQRIGVYHVSLSTGAIEFVNLRHINADFQLRVYNGGEGPFPQHIERHWLNKQHN